MFARGVLLVTCLSAGLTNPATASAQSRLQYPLDVAVDGQGTIYVADRKLPGIWKITDGSLSLFFQGEKTFRTPLNAVRCLAVGTDGALFAGDSATREVYRFDDGQPVPLTGGEIGIPSDLLIDGDRVIASDLELQRIWSFPVSGGKPKEIAAIAGVRGLVHDDSGQLVCVTTQESPLRRIGPDGKVEVVLSGQPFELPHHVCRIGSDLFIADNYAATIWKVSLEGEPAVEPFVSGDPLVRPVGICADGDSLLVADPHARNVFRVSMDKKVTPVLQAGP